MSDAAQDLPPAELWVLITQIVLSLVLLICAAALVGFQTTWLGHPSGLSGFLLFVSFFSLALSSVLLALPLLARCNPSYAASARFLREGRAGTILRAAPLAFTFFAAMAQAISTGVAKGCKDHAADAGKVKKGRNRDQYESALPAFCASKVAAAVFAWFLLATSAVTLLLFLLAYRADRAGGQHVPIEGRDAPATPRTYGPRDPELHAASDYDSAASYDCPAVDTPYAFEQDAHEFKYEPESEMDEYSYYVSRYGGGDADADADADAAVTSAGGDTGNYSFDYGAYRACVATPRI